MAVIKMDSSLFLRLQPDEEKVESFFFPFFNQGNHYQVQSTFEEDALTLSLY